MNTTFQCNEHAKLAGASTYQFLHLFREVCSVFWLITARLRNAMCGFTQFRPVSASTGTQAQRHKRRWIRETSLGERP